MRPFIISAAFAMILSGCASSPAPETFGNFAERATPADDKWMADDAAKQLATLYPPASTRINLQLATPDAFGTSLVAALRVKGYALGEFQPVPPPDARGGAMSAVAGQPGDITLAYVVDQPMEAGMYRVTVLMNSQSLSRLYQMKDGALAPAGYWVRKE